MTSQLTIAAGGAAALVAVTVWAIAFGRTPAPVAVPKPTVVVPTETFVPKIPKSFENKWIDAGLAIRSDRLDSAPPMPRKVQPVAVAPPPDVEEPEPARSAAPKPVRVAHDICRGKGRVYSKNGKSWKCRR